MLPTRRTLQLNLKFFRKSRFFDDFFRNFENPRKLGTYSKIDLGGGVHSDMKNIFDYLSVER